MIALFPILCLLADDPRAEPEFNTGCQHLWSRLRNMAFSDQEFNFLRRSRGLT